MAFKIGDKFKSGNGTHDTFSILEYVYDGKVIGLADIAKKRIAPNQLSYKLIRPSKSYTIKGKNYDMSFNDIILDEAHIQKNLNIGSWIRLK